MDMKHLEAEDSITLSHSELQNIVNIAVKSFIENNQYVLSKREAEVMFGRTTMNMLLTNKLLSDSKKIGSTKCRYVMSDIISGIEVLKKMKAIQQYDRLKINRRNRRV